MTAASLVFDNDSDDADGDDNGDDGDDEGNDEKDSDNADNLVDLPLPPVRLSIHLLEVLNQVLHSSWSSFLSMVMNSKNSKISFQRLSPSLLRSQGPPSSPSQTSQ